MLGIGSSGSMPVGATVRLYWPGVEKNITLEAQSAMDCRCE
jgi:hypothetical protein